jgi:hypothetical protein
VAAKFAVVEQDRASGHIRRLQAANVSGRPVLLDYSKFRGHSPVLPLSERIEALTDRMAFLCSQLQLPV